VPSGEKDQDVDWRAPLIKYIRSPGDVVDRKIRHQALKYTVMDDKLYRRTNQGLLLRCLDEEAARVAVGDVHGGLCSTHQSAKKMRWILK
jgi:hypothetical protein